ncbi:MAG: hypothetical protein A2Y84_02255 [Candidatus Colwellbacteria bacterium RBG_13_48_8]|uniref:AAA+ ATPase domain-containing protein n=1 Tax=Candidatus Colwellbacteria bacterium RBG_13_48_8 TaxID=1797685 RepID=A0A1G1YXH3_9BACT|nr:MAG: hypothetical protein A2Y84_02255 [Candidatus Colwellbacteria bacterium RBG_13_48_8]
MIIGHQDKVAIFKKLIREDKLSHGYVFFGENQVGKCHFALHLANFLEKGEFTKSDSGLGETLLLRPIENSLGIDAVREIKRFLLQKPVASRYRVVIIDDAETLTSQAQNAVLKITEEPPDSSLIILIVNNIESLLATLRSRLQRVYFTRVSQKEIAAFLQKEYRLDTKKALETAAEALGRPGRAVNIVTSQHFEQARQLAEKCLKNRGSRRSIVDAVLEEDYLLNEFITQIVIKLSRDLSERYTVLDNLIDRYAKINAFNTNKRLQLESALWNI